MVVAEGIIDWEWVNRYVDGWVGKFVVPPAIVFRARPRRWTERPATASQLPANGLRVDILIECMQRGSIMRGLLINMRGCT